MTPADSYLSGQLDYAELSDDEKNGIVARMEGIRNEDGWWYVPHRGGLEEMFGFVPDYLHDWSLCGPLIEKYKLCIEPYTRMGNDDWWASYEMTTVGIQHTPLAAIVHAVCEIAKEQHQEASDA